MRTVRQILNIAHRGFTKQFPDNTLEAFEAAIKIPVDGIECDVRETADGRFVMYHDPELLGRDISQWSLADIQAVMLQEKYRIPTLEQALDLCRQRVKLNIELKRVWSLDRFLEVLRARLSPEEVVLTSFNRDLVLELSRLAPDIKRGVITAAPIEDPVALTGETLSDILVLMFPFASVELARQAHAADLPVFVWGCTDMTQVRSALEMEIDGIISDWPDETANELARMGETERRPGV